jgi:hydroxymethylglutaryl-CoA lyase
MNAVKLIECPRDAMQGLHDFIPTDVKIDYLNALLQVGFDTLDFGSFVSPKAIPQMRDSAEVLEALDVPSQTKLLAIVANPRGAQDACVYDQIRYIGYPFSISETFQMRNTNASIEASLSRVEEIQKLCQQHQKELVLYISMAFGNPYGEAWHADLATQWAVRLHRELDVRILALSDTIGIADGARIASLFKTVLHELPAVEVGAHLHTTPDTWEEKVVSAYTAGCRRFDGALQGFGGCPMAADSLTGNMPTEKMIRWFNAQGIATGIDNDALERALNKASLVF